MYKKITLVAILVVLFVSLLFFVLREDPEDAPNIQKLTFEIIDSTTHCEDALDEIYRDEEYVYYLTCLKRDSVRIKFSDGMEYPLMEAITSSKVTIDELMDKGLEIMKYPIGKISENYIEKVPKNAESFLAQLNKDKILLTEEEISAYNEQIKKKADMVYDMKITSITKKEILSYINQYSLPSLPKYNGKTVLNTSNTKVVLENRNLEKIVDLKTIQKGIIVQRANLRSFPSDIHFYDQYNVSEFDRLQESELLINTPVLILHESKDKKWNFVMSPFYVGWVKKDFIALADEEDYAFFIEPKSFVVATEASNVVEGVTIDMSAKLPYIGMKEEGYQVYIPIKNEDGFVSKKQITLKNDVAHIGYLPYTKRNIIIQAFKYEGVKYSWSGLDKGVDCSSYVSNVYRTFGIQFPRNTSSQNKSVGKITSLANKTANEKLNIIKNTSPSLLYQNGHVMLYLGMKNNKHYIIHASGSEMKVVVTELKVSSSYLTNIHRVITVS